MSLPTRSQPPALDVLGAARAQALEAWAEAWARVQASSLDRQTRAALLAEARHLELALDAYLAGTHADVEAHLDAARRAEAAGGPNVLVRSHEHAVEMALHHAHALIADVRDGFLDLLRRHDRSS